MFLALHSFFAPVFELIHDRIDFQRRYDLIIPEDYQQEESENYQLVLEVVGLEECPVAMMDDVHQFVAETDR